jgi:hypothetical protein
MWDLETINHKNREHCIELITVDDIASLVEYGDDVWSEMAHQALYANINSNLARKAWRKCAEHIVDSRVDVEHGDVRDETEQHAI